MLTEQYVKRHASSSGGGVKSDPNLEGLIVIKQYISIQFNGDRKYM